jgi:hypothetical protein
MTLPHRRIYVKTKKSEISRAIRQTHPYKFLFCEHKNIIYILKIKITFWYRLLCNSFILVSFILSSTTCFDPFNWSSSGGYRFSGSCYTNLLMSVRCVQAALSIILKIILKIVLKSINLMDYVKMFYVLCGFSILT